MVCDARGLRAGSVLRFATQGVVIALEILKFITLITIEERTLSDIFCFDRNRTGEFELISIVAPYDCN